jgi:hypothetical protein
MTYEDDRDKGEYEECLCRASVAARIQHRSHA